MNPRAEREELPAIESTFERRCEQVLAVASRAGCRNLILGSSSLIVALELP